MKRYSDLYSQICSFDNIYKAYLNARKGKRYRQDVLEFTAHLEENLIGIQNELIWKTYQVGRYKEFYVYEPKKRLIMALPFKDRVVQWAIYQVLNPLLDKSFIRHSYACRNGMGTHSAAKRLQHWLRLLDRKPNKWYYLKLDISKYFYRVDHAILIKILERRIKDKDLMWLLGTIINSEKAFGLPPGVEPGDCVPEDRLMDKGMPIGNLTSQMFANFYLNELDQFCKHELRIRYYIRYMDDVIILYHDKKYLHSLKSDIEVFLSDSLALDLNNKTCIRPISTGIDFVGYQLWPTHVKIKKKTALKMKRRLKYLQKAYSRKEVGLDEVNASVQSYLGMLKHCNSYKFKKKLLSELVFAKGDAVKE